jgi:hypothetical protein
MSGLISMAEPTLTRPILYDFVLVDGPPARNTEETIFNRLGAIELIENNLADNFVAIVDDAERRGEAALVNLIRRKLQESKRDFRETAIMAAKQQAVFVAALYSCCAFFDFRANLTVNWRTLNRLNVSSGSDNAFQGP